MFGSLQNGALKVLLLTNFPRCWCKLLDLACSVVILASSYRFQPQCVVNFYQTFKDLMQQSAVNYCSCSKGSSHSCTMSNNISCEHDLGRYNVEHWRVRQNRNCKQMYCTTVYAVLYSIDLFYNRPGTIFYL